MTVHDWREVARVLRLTKSSRTGLRRDILDDLEYAARAMAGDEPDAVDVDRLLVCCGDDEYLIEVLGGHQVQVLCSSSCRNAIQLPTGVRKVHISVAKCYNRFGEEWDYNEVWALIGEVGLKKALKELK